MDYAKSMTEFGYLNQCNVFYQEFRYYLRLDVPISPSRPDIKSQKAAGIGTGEATPSSEMNATIPALGPPPVRDCQEREKSPVTGFHTPVAEAEVVPSALPVPE